MLRPKNIPKMIIEVEKGTNCAQVNSIILNKSKKTVDSLLVSKLDEDGNVVDKSDALYVLPFSSLEGIGDYGIIIMSENEILEKRGDKEKKEFYSGKGNIIDCDVVSLKGNKVGTVSDYEFSEDGNVVSISIKKKNNDGTLELEKRHILSFGNGIIIVRIDEKSYHDKSKSGDDDSQDSDETDAADERSHDVTEVNEESNLENSSKKEEDVEEEKHIEEPEQEVQPVEDNTTEERTEEIFEEEKPEEVEELSEEERQRIKVREEAKKFAEQMAMRTGQSSVPPQVQVEEEVAEETETEPVEEVEEVQSDELAHQVKEEQQKIEKAEKDGIRISNRRRHPKSNQNLIDDDQMIQKFIDKQKTLLVGRVLTKDILDSKGKVLLEAGTEITEELFDLAREERKDTIVEMAMFSE